MKENILNEFDILTEEELSAMDDRLKKTEEEGIKNLLKHFDRLHDKLFNFNNILIAGYFALSKIQEEISLLNILIPIGNLIILLFIEYQMMEKSRFESEISKKNRDEINQWGKNIKRTNIYSLLSIISTSIVTIIFLAYFFKR